MFKANGIVLDIGHCKNTNKNPVAERAIEELGRECLHINPEGNPLKPLGLALATANMNARIRSDGLSAREMWTQRDQITGEQLPIHDCQILLKQQFDSTYNHGASAKSKCHGRPAAKDLGIQVGDLVYIAGDHDKTKARYKYIVVSTSDTKCQVRKFVKDQLHSKTYDLRISDC